MLGLMIKQPADDLDYDIDFGNWLPDDDTILTVETAVDVEGELTVDEVNVDSPVVKVWCSGGETGTTYKVTVTVATQGGRVKEVDFKIRVRDF